MKQKLRIPFIALLLTISLGLAGCSGIKSEAKYPTGADRAATNDDIYAEAPSIFGKGGLGFLGGKNKQNDNGIGVNSYLWRASLDTISFMPLDNADPFGGVITTDWYSPESNSERVKVNVLILSKKLKADGITVKVFKQVKKSGTWTDMAVSDQVERELETAILTRARQLNVADLQS